MQNLTLLDQQANAASCMCLSDLRIPIHYADVRKALQELNPNQYPLSMWQEAIQYICGIKQNFANAAEAKKFLLQYLIEK